MDKYFSFTPLFQFIKLIINHISSASVHGQLQEHELLTSIVTPLSNFPHSLVTNLQCIILTPLQAPLGMVSTIILCTCYISLPTHNIYYSDAEIQNGTLHSYICIYIHVYIYSNITNSKWMARK